MRTAALVFGLLGGLAAVWALFAMWALTGVSWATLGVGLVAVLIFIGAAAVMGRPRRGAATLFAAAVAGAGVVWLALGLEAIIWLLPLVFTLLGALLALLESRRPPDRQAM